MIFSYMVDFSLKKSDCVLHGSLLDKTILGLHGKGYFGTDKKLRLLKHFTVDQN